MTVTDQLVSWGVSSADVAVKFLTHSSVDSLLGLIFFFGRNCFIHYFPYYLVCFWWNNLLPIYDIIVLGHLLVLSLVFFS